jgi:cysteinyl-tRNA synthetase
MEYKPEALEAASRGLQHLYNQVRQLGTETNEIIANFKTQFLAAINDDLNMSKALAVVQDVLKSDATLPDKLATIYDFDRVLGLRLDLANDIEQVPAEIILLKEERERARTNKEWQRADEIRKKIEGQGFILEDSSEGSNVRRTE